MLVIDTRIKLLLFILINFMVFGLKDFILGSVCFFFICILSCLMGQKKIVLKYLIFYVVIAAIQQLCAFLPQAIETILSIFTLFIRVMIPVVLFASTFIATTKVSELIAAMYSLKIPRSIGYSVYMMFFALGTYLPMVIMTGYVDDMSTSNGVSAEYLAELHSFMNGTMVVIIAVVTFVAGIIGALIAKGVFKKHFQKAGIV